MRDSNARAPPLRDPRIDLVCDQLAQITYTELPAVGPEKIAVHDVGVVPVEEGTPVEADGKEPLRLREPAAFAPPPIA
jgi:hypothetical protein